MSVSALEALAANWSRFLDAVCLAGQISHPLPGLSSSPLSHPDIVSDILSRISSIAGLAPGGSEDVVQGCLGNRPRSGSRLLHSSFPGGKGDEGGWRPVIDLSHLNEFVWQTPFKMETVASVLLSVREGDFLASIDLKDVYFQIPVHQSLRKLLRFLSEGTVSVQGPVLWTVDCPTGLHQGVCRGIRLLRYLDDWLVLASSEVEAKKNIQDLLSVCHSLGIVINEKSDLVPSQTAHYLGMTIDTGAARIFPSHARVEKYLSVAETFCTMSAPPAQLWQVVLGHLASLERLVPHSCLRMRSLQWHLKTHWSPESDPPSLPMPLSREVREDLSWWMVRDDLLKGVRFGTPAPDLHLYSVGVGRTPPRPGSVKVLVGAGEVAAHLSSRNESIVSGIAVISGVGRRSPCDRDVRQLDGGGLCQQAVSFAHWPASF